MIDLGKIQMYVNLLKQVIKPSPIIYLEGTGPMGFIIPFCFMDKIHVHNS